MIITASHPLFIDSEKYQRFAGASKTSLTIPLDGKTDIFRGDIVEIFELRNYSPTGRKAECKVKAVEQIVDDDSNPKAVRIRLNVLTERID